MDKLGSYMFHHMVVIIDLDLIFDTRVVCGADVSSRELFRMGNFLVLSRSRVREAMLDVMREDQNTKIAFVTFNPAYNEIHAAAF